MADLPVAPPQAGSYQTLVFAETFATLDVGDMGIHTWYTRTALLNDAQETPPSAYSLVNVNDTVLRLRTERVDAGVWTPAALYSFDGANLTGGRAWRNGYFEVRMRWTPALGSWPVLRLFGLDFTRGTNPNAAQIGIFEGQGGDPFGFYAISHLGDTAAPTGVDVTNDPIRYPVQADLSEFHTYGLLWQPGQLSWFLDDVAVASAPSFHTQEAQDMYLQVGIQEGLALVQNADGPVPSSAFTMDVDFINVFQ